MVKILWLVASVGMLCGLVVNGRVEHMVEEVGNWIWGWRGWVRTFWDVIVGCIGRVLKWYLVG